MFIEVDHRWLLLSADIYGFGTAGMETAPYWRLQGAGDDTRDFLKTPAGLCFAPDNRY